MSSLGSSFWSPCLSLCHVAFIVYYAGVIVFIDAPASSSPPAALPSRVAYPSPLLSSSHLPSSSSSHPHSSSWSHPSSSLLLSLFYLWLPLLQLLSLGSIPPCWAQFTHVGHPFIVVRGDSSLLDSIHWCWGDLLSFVCHPRCPVDFPPLIVDSTTSSSSFTSSSSSPLLNSPILISLVAPDSSSSPIPFIGLPLTGCHLVHFPPWFLRRVRMNPPTSLWKGEGRVHSCLLGCC